MFDSHTSPFLQSRHAVQVVVSTLGDGRIPRWPTGPSPTWSGLAPWAIDLDLLNFTIR
jgi:hypothetical protein